MKHQQRLTAIILSKHIKLGTCIISTLNLIMQTKYNVEIYWTAKSQELLEGGQHNQRLSNKLVTSVL
jgi:hypothetical protein